MSIYVAGVDVGFRKTGYTLFEVGRDDDRLVFAKTLGIDYEPPKTRGRKFDDDMDSVINMAHEFEAVIREQPPVLIFAEVPVGGGQSARALRCMSLATGWFASMEYMYKDILFELFKPSDVEFQLGIRLGKEDKKRLGLTHGKLTAYKKERIRELVIAAFPGFAGWPKTKAASEDAYDSAAAFMCGRMVSDSYFNIKQRVNS